MSELAKSIASSSAKELIDVVLYYQVITNKYGNTVFRTIPEDKAKEMLEKEDTKKSVEVLNTKWKVTTWKEQNSVIQRSQKTNPDTLQHEIEWTMYRDAMIKSFLVAWDLEDDGKKIPVNPANIDNLPADIVLALYNKYERATNIDPEQEGKL